MREVGRDARVRPGTGGSRTRPSSAPSRPLAPVRRAEVQDEARRRVRLAAAGRVVAAARGERAADHVQSGVDRLERVVGLRPSSAQVGAGGRVEPVRRRTAAARSGSRFGSLPTIKSRIDGNAPRDRGRVGRELGPRGSRSPGVVADPTVDGDDQADPVGRGRVGDALERRRARRRRRRSRPGCQIDVMRIVSSPACRRAPSSARSGSPVARRVLGRADEQRPGRAGETGAETTGAAAASAAQSTAMSTRKKTHRKSAGAVWRTGPAL